MKIKTDFSFFQMAEYNVCQLSKLPKEILVKMLLAKDNTGHFDLSYCYRMKDKLSSRIEKLKTEEIKRKLIEQIKCEEEKDKKEIFDFISKITKISFLQNDDLEFEYLNYKISMYYDEIRVTQDEKPVYIETFGEIQLNLTNLNLELNYSLQKFHQIICTKNVIYTVFENIGWFLDNDKLELTLN